MLYDQETGRHTTECSNDYTHTKQMCPFIETVFRETGRVCKAHYYDTVMTENWHSGWNKMDIIVAFSPGNTVTFFHAVKMAYLLIWLPRPDSMLIIGWCRFQSPNSGYPDTKLCP